ncbi:MAG: transposase [Myxococcota bacterium]
MASARRPKELVSEIESFSRFTSPRQLMAYAGVVPSESSSGASVRRGGITKTGNAHVRRVLMESAWNARFIPKVAHALKRRQSDAPQVRENAWRAQQRLHKRYTTLKARGKAHQKVLVAVAREMLGFIWDIACTVEHKYMLERRSAA